MLCEVRSLGLSGISGYEVRAECDLSAGLPAFEIVGLPDAAVKEARDRVRAAIKNCGFTFPVSRITVNLAPANQRKGGTVYDLPILAGILAAGGQLRLDGPDSAYVGELSLSGSLRPVVGMLPMALAARRAGIKRLYVPAPSAAEATLAGGLEEPLSELLLSALACAGIALIMNAVALPLLLKFGAEKARMVSMALFLLVFAGFALLGLAADRGLTLPAPPAWVLTALPGLLAILAVGGFALSYCIAQAIYARKEF